MATRYRLLLPALTLSLLAAPLGALADKPKISTRDEARAAQKEKRVAEKKKRAAERKKREAEQKKREAEQEQREAEQRREEQRRAERQRRAEEQAEQRRAAAARARAAVEARRQAAAQKRTEMARRAAERRAEANALQASRREAEERARAAEKAEARRRAAEARAAEAEARQREIEARKVEAARREAAARQAERDRQAEAARREAAARQAERDREAEREHAEQARRAALAEAAERQAAEAARAREIADRAKQPGAPITAGGAPSPTPGAPLTGADSPDRRRPIRRPEPEPDPARRQPIPRPEPEPAPGSDGRQPIPRPDPEPGPDPAGPPELGRHPQRPLPEARGPRRADRRPPGDGRADWDDTVDRVADEAGRPPPPPPIRRPGGWDGRRERRRRDRYDAPYPDPQPYRPQPYPPQPYPAEQPHPAEQPYPEGPAEPSLDPGAPMGQRAAGLTAADGERPAAPPPIATGSRSAPPPMLDPATDTRSASDWFDGFTARGAYAGWSFQPLGDLPTGGGGARTYERYTVSSLDLYRADAILDTRWARIQARYESNRGFGIGRDDALFDLLVGLRAVPGLEGLSFEYLDLDFVHGRVDLIDAADGAVIETTPLKVDLRTIDIAYPLGQHVTVFGRRFDSVMPRNVYLERQGSQSPLQISEQLLAVDATAYGAGLAVAKADDGEGLFGGIKGWIGVGPYDIRTVSGGLFLDGGWLTAGGAEAHIGWRQPLGAGFSVGIHDTLTVLGLDPNGLPSGMQRDLAAEGLASDDLSLQFGTVELLNGLHVDLTWSI